MTQFSKIPLLLLVLILINNTCLSQITSKPCRHFTNLHDFTTADFESDFDMKYVRLHLTADNLSTEIAGFAEMLIVPTVANLKSIKLDLVDALNVSNVSANTIEADFEHNEDTLRITFASSFSISDSILLHIEYSGVPNPASSGIFAGINSATSNNWSNQITWTLSEPFNAKYWWPSKQDLSDKIDSVQIEIVTNDHLKAASNGLLVESKALANNQIQYTWKTLYPIAYYLLAFTIGEYVEYNNYAHPDELDNDSIFIQNYIYNNPNTLTQYQPLLDEFPKNLELYCCYFGVYPFHQEKYGHVMAPIGGGMEHQTMSTMSLFSFGLNAHELGHQWFGDLATCASWRDIWLNEGFARFCEYFASEKLLSKNNAKTIIASEINDVLAARTGSIYIPKNEELTDGRIFNFKLTYQKGGLFLNMIRNVIKNDDLFFQTIKDYLNTYQFRTATAEDFRLQLEEHTGLDFSPMFNEWYYGEGYPVFDITWQKIAGDSLSIYVSQTPTGSTPLFTTPLEFEITYESGQLKRIFVQPEAVEQNFKIAANGSVKSLTFDKDNWMIKKVNSYLELDPSGNPILSSDSPNQPLLYPNPAEDFIHFKTTLKQVKIFDAAGKLHLERSANAENIESVEIKNLQPGFYIIQTEGLGIQNTYKLIKN